MGYGILIEFEIYLIMIRLYGKGWTEFQNRVLVFVALHSYLNVQCFFGAFKSKGFARSGHDRDKSDKVSVVFHHSWLALHCGRSQIIAEAKPAKSIIIRFFHYNGIVCLFGL